MIQVKTSISKRSILKFALVAPLLFSGVEVNAANWLMLQGTEPDMVESKGVKVPNRNKVPKLWGFIQANYEKDF
ncbi:MAG TPA: hypothetical protein VIM88_09795, partial [Sulfurovum sp.]|uniref:hypothetical protein n=1 Tax=Sulfurovum sp. TaxID=1969726 RepID=UPI002F92EE41